MASRHEVGERKTELLRELREHCLRHVHVGGVLPSLRALAVQYDVSVTVVRQATQTLKDEGLIETSSTSGSRIIQRRFDADQAFLFGMSDEGQDEERCGFTERMAELGAFVLEIPLDQIAQHDPAEWGTVRGMWCNTFDPDRRRRIMPPFSFPVAGFGDHIDPDVDDAVTWDDLEGGRLATQHLLAVGHESIVLVGDYGGPGHWAHQRAEGFRRAMAEAGRSHQATVVPWDNCPLSREDAAALGRHAADQLLTRSLPDAVIAVNDVTAGGFLAHLRQASVPLSQWPAIVGFDDELTFGGQCISSLRLDKRVLGYEAADLLWQRATGALTGPPIVRTISPRLVPRMTSQSRWASRINQLLPDFPLSRSAAVRPESFLPL